MKVFIRKGPAGWRWMCGDQPELTAYCCGFNWGYDDWGTAFARGRTHAFLKHGVRL